MRTLISALIFFSPEISGDLIGYNRLGNNLYYHINREPRQPLGILQQIENQANLSPEARAQFVQLYSELQNRGAPKPSKAEARKSSEYERRRRLLSQINLSLY